MVDENRVVADVRKALADAIEALRWCRQHLHESSVAAKLQEIDITLGALALALDQGMDGQAGEAATALLEADWQTRPSIWGWHDDISDLH